MVSSLSVDLCLHLKVQPEKAEKLLLSPYRDFPGLMLLFSKDKGSIGHIEHGGVSIVVPYLYGLRHIHTQTQTHMDTSAHYLKLFDMEFLLAGLTPLIPFFLSDKEMLR